MIFERILKEPTSHHESQSNPSVDSMPVEIDGVVSDREPEEQVSSLFQHTEHLHGFFQVSDWVQSIAVATETAVFQGRIRRYPVIGFNVSIRKSN